MNYIIIYLIIGIVWTYIIEYINKKFIKNHPIEKAIKNNEDLEIYNINWNIYFRLFLIISWPLGVIKFLYEYFNP